MSGRLKISAGQYSDKGRKDVNQDYHGLTIPQGLQLSTKGIAIALADGISSSTVSQIASQAAVAGFLADYYCTSEAWTVKKSAQRVMLATNSWLYAQTRQSDYRFDKNRGYVCTFSALILKSATAHLFHVGDTRIYRLHGNCLEQLTEDHRFWLSSEQSYLSRALGIDNHLEIDYQALSLEIGDIFVLATDGVYEFVGTDFMIDAIASAGNELDAAAEAIVGHAFDRGSDDNLTVQLIRIDDLPQQDATEHLRRLNDLPLPPLPESGAIFDGFTIVRPLSESSRSHVFLAIDIDTGTKAVLKIPSLDRRDDPAYLDRFLLEDWIAKRINSPYVLKSADVKRKRNYLYNVTEYIEGKTLKQWLLDNPKPSLETVRGLAEQIANGLRAFHRMEMLHQDVRPDNILIDGNGSVKLIDFGSVSVAGLLETDSQATSEVIPGTAQFAAPEYFLGECGSSSSDLFSLGVVIYHLLTGDLPYGVEIVKCKSKTEQNRLIYRDMRLTRLDIPPWVDAAVKKAVHINPYKRYEALSEFIRDLRYPNENYLDRNRPALLERNPLAFWKGTSIILAMAVVLLLYKLHRLIYT